MPLLLVDDVDYSDEYGYCIASSGYIEAALNQYDTYELEKVRQLAATLQWAGCARDEGYRVIDPEGVRRDNWLSRPTAGLPASIGEFQLRALLLKCPIGAAVDIGGATVPDAAAAAAPNIGIDVPGYRGRGETETVDDAELSKKLDSLWM
jgi:hypothetical protein